MRTVDPALLEKRPYEEALVKFIIAAEEIEVTNKDVRTPINKKFFKKKLHEKGTKSRYNTFDINLHPVGKVAVDKSFDGKLPSKDHLINTLT